MARYTEKDAAKDTDVSIREVNRAWHDARDHAQASGELEERAIYKASKKDIDNTITDKNSEIDLTNKFPKALDIMDSTNEPHEKEAQEKFQEFVDNGKETTENIQDESDLSLDDTQDVYEGFQENEEDITNDNMDSSSNTDIFQEFEENRLDFTEPNSTEETYEEFSENASDITGQTDTESEYDESNYDLKP